MKKFLKIAALVLVFIFIAASFASCTSKTGKPLLTCEGKSVSVNLYQLYLSRMKANLASYGYDVTSEGFWNTVVEMNGKTLDEHYLDIVLSEAKQSLAILCLFDGLEKEGKLSFADEYKNEINETVNGLIEYDAEGSKSKFNAILASYGANIDVLKLAYEIEVKKGLLTSYYFGNNGSQISEDVKQQYLEENYVAFKQILISNFYYEYETDKNGDDIYYTDTGKISYDRENGKPNYVEGNTPEYDSDGNIIYYLENGSIAYDTKTGKRKNKVDENGKNIVTDYTDEEMKEYEALVEELEEKLADGDTAAFESAMYKYAELSHSTAEELSGAYYVRSNETSSYDYINKIVDALNSSNVGDIKIIPSDYGYHIVMKYELEENAYSNENNSVYFEDFISDLTTVLLKTHTDKYMSKIQVDEKLLEGISMNNTEINFYY